MHGDLIDELVRGRESVGGHCQQCRNLGTLSVPSLPPQLVWLCSLVKMHVSPPPLPRTRPPSLHPPPL